MLRTLFITLVTMSPLVAGANEYRGMPAGWPASNVGVPAVPVTAGYAPAAAPAGYGFYQANRPSYAAPSAYYASRPVESATTAYYSTLPNQAPSYSQVNYTQPVTAYYSPPGYAATPMITAYSPGVAAGMSPVYGISPQPGTMLQQQRSYYGSAGALNFAPPAVPVTYRAYYAPAAGAVTLYRPVTVYQPATGQPVTCLQPVAPAYQTCGTASCAPAGCGTSGGCGSSGCGWGLFSWLCNRCNSSGCGTTCGTAGCAPSGCAPAGCGQQPYYPVPVNTIPVVPSTTIPVVPAPVTTTPPLIGAPRVPPPPTRILGPGGAADTPPSLAPGGLPSTTVTPVPGPTYSAPGTTIPGTTTPIPSSPYTPVPPGSTPATEYYPPAPGTESRFESNRFAPPTVNGNSNSSNNTLRFSPPANSAPNGVKVVPDPDASLFKPTNQAPPLLNPRDRSARLTNPWAVVPAVWPSKQQAVARTPQHNVPNFGQNSSPNKAGGRVSQATRSNASRQLNERTDFAPTSAFVRQVDESLDDSGWSSGR